MGQLIFSIEDDLNIQNVIQIALENSNYVVELFSDGNLLFEQLQKKTPDLILLDIMLPGLNGIEILKKIKSNQKWMSIPIMIISAKASEIDKVIGLDSGADDYLIKPFGVLELVSRVKSLLRRSKPDQESDILTINDLKIYPKKYTCMYIETPISLTKKQFELLKLFMQNNNSIVSREVIMNIVWGYEYVGETRTVDVHIKELRKKLKIAGVGDSVIETIRGIGYKFTL